MFCIVRADSRVQSHKIQKTLLEMNNVNNNKKRTTWTILPKTHSRIAQNIKHRIISRLTFSSEPKHMHCQYLCKPVQLRMTYTTHINTKKKTNKFLTLPPTHPPKCCPPKWSLLSVTVAAFHQGFHSNGKLTTHVNCTWHHCEGPGMNIKQMTGDQKVQGYKRFGRQPAVGHFLQEDRCQH